MQHSGYGQSAAMSASPAAPSNGVNLRALIDAKQHELAVIHDYQSRSLTADNAALQAALHAAHERHEKLKADFTYNLELLRARDAELARYDELSVTYAQTLAAKSDEAAEQVRRLESSLEARSMELAAAHETAEALRARTAELQERLSTTSWSAEAERRALEHNGTRATRELEAKLREKEEAASKLSYELMYNFGQSKSTSALFALHGAVSLCNATSAASLTLPLLLLSLLL